jgi:hypothetical protein
MSWPLISDLSIIKVLSNITQIHIVDAARSNCRVHSGVDGDTPFIIDEEGTTANVDGMERAALSVHTVHQWLTFLQMPVATAAAQQHKQQITIRLHKVELVISKFWK